MGLSRKSEKPRKPQSSDKVLIEHQLDGVKATLLGLPDYQGFGATEEEAVNNLIALFQERNPKIVLLKEIAAPQVVDNPWLKIAGKYKDDPQFEKMLEYIAEYRRDLDGNNQLG